MTRTRTDKQVIEQRDTLEMLKRTHLWPGSGRTINLKHGTDGFALCQQATDGSYRLWRYKAATYELEDTPAFFADAEGIVDAGWEVD